MSSLLLLLLLSLISISIKKQASIQLLKSSCAGPLPQKTLSNAAAIEKDNIAVGAHVARPIQDLQRLRPMHEQHFQVRISRR